MLTKKNDNPYSTLKEFGMVLIALSTFFFLVFLFLCAVVGIVIWLILW
jgi:hypothetical protein